MLRWILRAPQLRVTNAASLAMYFGCSVDLLLTQDLQVVLHNTPLQAGLKLLTWTGAMLVVAPIAGVLSARFGARPFLVVGLAAQATALSLLAATATTTTSYTTLLLPFILAAAAWACSRPVRDRRARRGPRRAGGQASGATNTIREVGGVSRRGARERLLAHGSYASHLAFVSGLVPRSGSAPPSSARSACSWPRSVARARHRRGPDRPGRRVIASRPV